VIRASIIFERLFAKRMDCRVKPGNDELLVRSQNSKGFHHVGAASDWSSAISESDPARLHRTAAGVLKRAGR
jgi:hypothetical protein